MDRLREELRFIEQVLGELDRNDKVLVDVPDYRTRVGSTKGFPEYFYRDEANKEVYIPSADREFARQLIQKDYNKRLRAKLLAQKRLIERFLKNYDPNGAEEIYEKMCKGRQVLVQPMIMPKAEYVEKWMEKHAGEQNTIVNQAKIKTDRGEFVRSKSEKILADLFYKNNIPYQYEPQIILKNGRKFYPDFVLLNVNTRKTIYWEHFGLASDAEYSNKNLEKLYFYEKEGMRVGENFVYTIETAANPIDVAVVEEKIQKYLLQ